MSVDLSLPKITGADADTKISQLSGYLYGLVGKLNWALNNIESSQINVVYEGNGASSGRSASAAPDADDAEKTFNTVKGLIINSADIAKAYYESFKMQFAGEYSGFSDFGDYVEKTSALLVLDPEKINQQYGRIEEIEGEISGIRETNAWIKTGKLSDEGNGVYGVEVGQMVTTTSPTGSLTESFQAFARFTANKLSFYDENGTEVAYISDRVLHITRAEISDSLRLGGYDVDTSDGITFKWGG